MNAPDRETESVEIVPEALVVVDLVESTRTTNLYGWYAVGRHLVRDLRECIDRLGKQYGLCCRKSTGDGYLLAFRNGQAADAAAVQAFQAIVAIARDIEERNKRKPSHQKISLRFALHFGQVDAVDNDREGPEVSFTFRLEGVEGKSVDTTTLTVPFPADNYAILSEAAIEILTKQQISSPWEAISPLRFKGFRGWHQVYLLRELSLIDL